MMNCIAIDDEPLALGLLKDNIGKVPFLNLVAVCNDAFEAMETMQMQQVDLVFIDIQMPGLTGLQYIESLETKPLVIFVTAYKQYAVESYDLNVVDYLVKPVALERFIKACNRARELFELKADKGHIPAKKTADHFFVNVDYSQIKIKFDDIIWMKGYGDYIKFHLKNSPHPLVVRTSFKALDTELPENKFIRIHKSYSVSIAEITAIRKNSIFLGDKELSIGETFRESVEKMVHK
jgi:DNA-binding LytR/AlgR family response regulator